MQANEGRCEAVHPVESAAHALAARFVEANGAADPALGDGERVRAGLLAFHELRAGREPIVATPSAAARGLRFPGDESLTFAAFVAGAAPETATEGARFAVGDGGAPAAPFVWTPTGLRAARPGDAAELRRVEARLAAALDALSRDANAPLAGVDLLPAEERARVLALAEGERIGLEGFHVLEQFLARANERGDRVAIVEGAGSITYEALARRARSYAAAFAARGVGRGDVVAIATPRSIESVAAILGAFWAGAAYLPLDPDYPAERLGAMVADAGAGLVVAASGFSWLPASAATMTPDDVAAGGDDWADAPVAAEPLAYVIYTSGSTGRPKGVRVTHRNIGKDLRGMQRVCDLGADEVFQSIFSLAFDVSVTELLFPLVLGGTTHVIPPADVLDGARMRAHFERNRPTVALVPRVLWEALFEAGWPGDPRLRAWTGGEQMRKPMAMKALKMVRALYNCYGPTETTISAAVHRVTADEHEPIPIGRPLPNVSMFVLDAAQRVQPFGFVGELYIGGEGVAQGYHRLDDLTVERFPELEIGGEKRRLYRTGDFVRRRPDGDVEFAGRRDEQVKLRGYRVELGEVAIALRSVAGVRDALALARDDELVAYVICAPELAGSDFAALRARAAQVLPRFMLPAHYVALDSFPVTINRKVDVERLPKPVKAAATAESGGVDVESVRGLARKWLQLPELKDDDDFRLLGATSLTLVRLAGAMRKLGWKVNVGDLYEHPSVSQIVAFTAARAAPAAPASAPSGPPPSAPAPSPAGLPAPASAGPPPAAPASAVPVTPSGPPPSAPAAPAEPPPAAPPSAVPVTPAEPAPVDREAALAAAREPLRASVSTPAYRWPISQNIAFPMIRAVVNHPHAASVNAVRWTFAKTPDLRRLRAAWASVAEDVAILRARVDLGPDAGFVVEPEVTLNFRVWDERGLSDVGFDWRVGDVERSRKEAGVDLAAWPYHALDVVLGPNDKSAVVLSNAGFLLDVETLENVVGELWGRYEGGVPPAGERPPPGQQRSPFGEDEPSTLGEAEGVYREMLSGVTRPTRLPFDALGLSLRGAAATLTVLNAYLRTVKRLARSPEVKRLLELGTTAEERNVSIGGVARAVVGLTAGAPTVEYAFVGAEFRAAVRERARELRAAEHALLIAALGVVLGRWTESGDVLVRMLVANRDDSAEGAAGRRTRTAPIRVVLSSGATVRSLVATTHRWITRVLENQNTSRDAYLRALPFPEPFTHAIYIAGEAPSPGKLPDSLGAAGVHVDELIDGIFGVAVAWERGEIAFHFDATLFRGDTIRARLKNYAEALHAFAAGPLDARIDALLG